MAAKAIQIMNLKKFLLTIKLIDHINNKIAIVCLIVVECTNKNHGLNTTKKTANQ